MLKGLNTKQGGPERVALVPGFFSGEMVAPVARVVAERVRLHNGAWKEDGHVVSVHVHPGIESMNDSLHDDGKAPVLEAQDGHCYRLRDGRL